MALPLYTWTMVPFCKYDCVREEKTAIRRSYPSNHVCRNPSPLSQSSPNFPPSDPTHQRLPTHSTDNTFKILTRVLLENKTTHMILRLQLAKKTTPPFSFFFFNTILLLLLLFVSIILSSLRRSACYQRSLSPTMTEKKNRKE